MKARRAATFYELVASGILEGLEAHVWKRSGADGLQLALDFALIADGARSIYERDQAIIMEAVEASPRVVSNVAEIVKRYCLLQIRSEPLPDHKGQTSHWRELSPKLAPSLAELLTNPIPAIDNRETDQESYPDWITDHAVHRRFYVTGLAAFMKRFKLTSRDVEWMALSGPEFVVAKTSWGTAPGDWKRPASKLQFNRAIRGEPLSLARAGLVIASVAAAAIDIGAVPDEVFADLCITPACFRVPTLTDQLIYGMSQNEPTFDHLLTVHSGRPRDLLIDMVKGYTVTLETARSVREMLFRHDGAAAVVEVVGTPERNTRGATSREEVQHYRT